MAKLIGIFLSAALLLMGSLLEAQNTQETINRIMQLNGEERSRVLEAEARKEGEVMIYTYRVLDETIPIVEAFMKRYPQVKAKVWRGLAVDVIERVLAEARAGRSNGDIYMGGIAELYLAKEKNRLVKYLSPLRAEYPQEFKDQAGYWVALDYIPNVIAYNPKMLKKEDVPKDYDDLLKKKYKGRIGLTTEPINMLIGLIAAWGETKTEEFLRRIVKVQGAHLRRGHTVAAQLLCAGEYEIHVELYAHRIADLNSKGCPIEMVIPKPTPAQIGPMAVMNDAPHSYAAILFYDWMLSREGMSKLAERGRLPSRPDVPPKFSMLKDFSSRAQVLSLTEESGRLHPKAIQLIKRYVTSSH